ncbi:aldehyde dehydrogenase family protein, partial [Salmonella sp. s54412]|uniref:aldehyde dehydrogenase family protein n=1 Tax=Salmonella sp. s54412 TaxID=3160128 RepID=UPI003755289E
NLENAIMTSHGIRAGVVWVNCYDIFEACCPFGGYKMSGAGRELGEYGLSQYSEVKTVITKIPQKNS